MTDATRLRLPTYSGSAATSLGLFKPRVAALLALAAVFLASAAAVAAKRSLPGTLGKACRRSAKKFHRRLPLQSDMTVAYINFKSGQQHNSLQYDAAH